MSEQLDEKLAALDAAEAVFSHNAVPYALIGGLAVGLRTGAPRATIDSDFAIPMSVDRNWLCERLAASRETSGSKILSFLFFLCRRSATLSSCR